MASALRSFGTARASGRLRFLGLALGYGLLVLACLWSLGAEGELSLGRNPLSSMR